MSTYVNGVNKVVTYAKDVLLLQGLGLEEEVQWLLDHNEGHNNPYHNTRHCFAMARRAYELAIMHGLSWKHPRVRSMVAAGIWHDMNHSAGKKHDAENIMAAIEGMQLFYDLNPEPASKINLPMMKQLIFVTEFPFVRDPETQFERIFRDADVMESLEPNFVDILVHGLRHEISTQHGRPVSVTEFCNGQLDFLQNKITLFTKPAKNLFEKAMPDLVKAFEELMDREPCWPHTP